MEPVNIIGRFSGLVAVGVLLSGCSAETAGNVGGGLVGGAAGFLIGGALGGSKGEAVGGLIGGVLGSYAGGAIARSLSTPDRRLVERATYSALDTPGSYGQPINWQSSSTSGARGSVQVISHGSSDAGTDCRRVRQIAYIDGEEIEEFQNFCRASDGRWRPV